jgi:deferrochelatase/peroxidase EfeB
VLRTLRQDVAGFWRRAYAHGETSAEAYAAGLVGRCPDGRPLAASRSSDNAFDFAGDPLGETTPLSAHIRKVHPRGEERFQPQRHRMIRRGMSFGEPVEPRDAEHAGGERGLVFNAFVASIERQFEYVQRLWANASHFPRDGAGRDALVGREDPMTPAYERSGSPHWRGAYVWTEGALYALAPSRPALRALASDHGSERG